jgi:hypothetical protein
MTTTIKVKRDDRFAAAGTFMDLEHHQCGVYTLVNVRTNGKRPRYFASRFYPDGRRMKLSAAWARSFIYECLGPMRAWAAS